MPTSTVSTTPSSARLWKRDPPPDGQTFFPGLVASAEHCRYYENFFGSAVLQLSFTTIVYMSMTWRLKMSAVPTRIRRENLFLEILAVLRQWSDLERSIFTQAHYKGQSLEAISHSLGLEVEKVSTILKQCDRQLHAALRNSCKSNCGKSLPIPAETDRLAACG